jgi:hypothetical protein
MKLFFSLFAAAQLLAAPVKAVDGGTVRLICNTYNGWKAFEVIS